MRKSHVYVGAMAMALIAGTALGQDTRPTRPDQPGTTPGQPPSTRPDTQPRGTPDGMQPRTRTDRNAKSVQLIPTDWVLGSNVLGSNRDKIATVQDLALAPRTGRVIFAVVSHGGVLGMGDQLVVVPWRAFTWDDQEHQLTLPITEDRLTNAPTITKDRWNQLSDQNFRQKVFSYFGIEPGAGMQDGQPGMRRPGDMDEPGKPGDLNNPGHTPRRGPSDEQPPTDPTRPGQTQPGQTQPGQNQPGQPDRMDQPGGRAGMSGNFMHARDITGQSVKTADDTTIGDVQTLVFDANSGRMGLVVLSVGGFLGIGETLVPVPFEQFRIDPEGKLIAPQNMTKENLKAAPKLEGRDWNQLRDKTFVTRVYQHFGADASWIERGEQGGQGMGGGQGMVNFTDDPAIRTAFQTGTPTDITGAISRVEQPSGAGAGGASGQGNFNVVSIFVRGDTGTEQQILLAPKNILDQQSFTLNAGDQVTVHGRQATVQGKQVVIAENIRANNKTLNLRSSGMQHQPGQSPSGYPSGTPGSPR